jgi:hypothetical protein
MWDIAFMLLAIIINVYILMYLINLEKIGCKCALNWRRTYIMFFIIFSVILSIASLFSYDILTSAVVMALFTVASIANVVIILQYISILKDEHCKCSEALAREIMHFIAILYAFFYVLLFIILIFMGFKASEFTGVAKNLAGNNPQKMTGVMKNQLTTASKLVGKK